MDQVDKERLERETQAELNRQFGDGSVLQVELLQYGDEPVIEPGQMMARVILTPTDEDQEETLHALEFTLPPQPGEHGHPVISISVSPPGGPAPGRNLTPVMARLDPTDVEVLDVLITAGIVSNRADGVRWALNRIRERPAYAQLREHIGKIDELKAQL